MSLDCPFCHLVLPLVELKWHVNHHITEDELVKDVEMAQQIALDPSSPIFMDKSMGYSAPSKASQWIPERSIPRFLSSLVHYKDELYQDKILPLVASQIRGTFHKIEGGLMHLVKRCLEKEYKNTISIIVGSIDHFQSSVLEDFGWGCGWRNIQMLSSHLLEHRKEARDALFGGSGFVPDIPSLQGWLEVAWERGFDIPGSESFDHKIYGSRKWIGTTECATLLRSFGLLARVVDFDSKSIESCTVPVKGSNHGVQKIKVDCRSLKGTKKAEQIFGPMDKFLPGRLFKELEFPSIQENGSEDVENYLSKLHPEHQLGRNTINCPKKFNGYQVLANWVWNYFFSEVNNNSSDSQHVLDSQKTPLYFQHDGHSRTIVGIQMQKGSIGMPDKYTFLILDPSQRTETLERALRKDSGWQKLLKRGVHTLRNPQYQMCYVDPGIANDEELEQLRTVDSVLINI